MALKSKGRTFSASRVGKKTTASFATKKQGAGDLHSTTLPKRRRPAPVETIEARLERKAAVADSKTFATKSLGQMAREQRHKLLYGD